MERVLSSNSTCRASQRAAEARLLVVEDDPNILELLAASLRHAGFEVATAPDGREALRTVRRFRPDLVVLDVMMPDIDGFEVARRLEAAGHRCPVVFLTARDALQDKITGLTIGGYDYVTKPFSLDEVMARIRAVLRRAATDGAPRAVSRLSIAGLELDTDTQEVWQDDEPVSLSPTEFRLLRCFMENAGRVLSKRTLLEYVWDYEFGGNTGIVESYVSHLRRKVEPAGLRLLHTVRGVGYVLRPPRG